MMRRRGALGFMEEKGPGMSVTVSGILRVLPHSSVREDGGTYSAIVPCLFTSHQSPSDTERFHADSATHRGIRDSSMTLYAF